MFTELKRLFLKGRFWFFASIFVAVGLPAQTPKLTLDITKGTRSANPMLYGLMTEQINHSYDGGLYAELIRNRIFKDNPAKPEA